VANDLKSKLKSHLDEVERKAVASNAVLQQKLTKEAEFLQQFDDVYKKVISPIFIEVRDSLLKRNLPAEIVDRKDDQKSNLSRYIGLHCSSDIKHFNNLKNDPMFRLYYEASKGALKMAANCILVNGKRDSLTNVVLRISDLSEENVEETVLNFVTACFPV
jgi:hypothetical protein